MNRDRVYLEHVLEALRDIQSFVRGMEEGDFVSDKKVQYAVMQAFEIIGEATHLLSQAFRNAHPEMPWRRMVDFRNKLIHHDFGISQKQVWNAVRENVPRLLSEVERLLGESEP